MRPLRIAIACPAKPGTLHGNRISALRWQRILRELGHGPHIPDQVTASDDLLLALHARRSATIVAESKKSSPSRPVIVAITGTDLYRDGHLRVTQETIQTADRLVVLQASALKSLPKKCHKKTHIIHQSVTPLRLPRPQNPRQLRVIVAGHLRAVKDPLRTAFAVRDLPSTSRIVVEHFGASLDESLRKKAQQESTKNDRYRLCGEVSRSELRRRLATCWMMVLSSRMEGGANVLSESIAQGTPVLASRIDGSIGLLGEDYSGYFDVGSTKQLKELLRRCEEDAAFYLRLRKQVERRSKLFRPSVEKAAWKKLLAEL